MIRLTIQLKLQPTPEQADALRQTLETANAACNAISVTAWCAKVFKQFGIHTLMYYTTKAMFGLSAQLVVRCIANVADAYKSDKKTPRTFQPLGAVAFDDRILSYTTDTVSIWTMNGRQTIPFVCGDRQRHLLQYRHGESDLVVIKGVWYLFATAAIETPEPHDVDGVLGVDVGIVNLATDSDGAQYSGAHVRQVREKRFQHRQRLQQANTRRARWRLRKLARKESRFQKDVNHQISKKLVTKAKHARKALAIEDLNGIRERTTVRRAERRQRASWAFHQLRMFLTYKAQRDGVPVAVVDPRNTSRTCSACGACDKRNRRSQDRFLCVACGYATNADVNAAVNISRAVVNQPLVSAPSVGAGYKPPPSSVR
jgi:IS605 OrfB family transposase